MPVIVVESPSPPPVSTPSPHATLATLVALSRNASVISSSSSNSSSSSLLLNKPPVRPGAGRIRTFSSPRTRSPARATTTPTRTKAPAYLTRELYGGEPSSAAGNNRASSKSKSRSSSAAGRLGPNDFEFGKTLGEGSYSTVMEAFYPRTRQKYAIKVIDKEPLIRKNLVRVAGIEKNALLRLSMGGHPGVIRLHWAFQDQWSVYLVLDLVGQGCLLSRINQLGSICLSATKWYVAQIIDTVVWMHVKGVVHRDLKPENVLIGDDMRIKISDYGSAKLFDTEKDADDRSNSWVCTPQYVPPELLIGGIMSRSSDFWAIGCILYQMLCGTFPFHGASNYLMWVKVRTLEYEFPEGFDETAKDLVRKLLVLDPETRLGAGESGTKNDLAALKAHPFFDGIDWERVWVDVPPALETGMFRKFERDEEGVEWENIVGEDGAETTSIETYESEDIQGQEESYTKSDEEDQLHPLHLPTPPVKPNAIPLPPPPSEDDIIQAHLARSPIQTPSHIPNHIAPLPTTSTVLSYSTPFPASPVETFVPSPGHSPPGSPSSRLTGFFDSLSLTARARSRRSSSTSSTSTVLSDTGLWMRHLRPSEVPVFSSCVLKKGGSKLMPKGRKMSFSRIGAGVVGIGLGKKDKAMRLLVLTKTRLLCLKEEDGEVVLGNEVLIGGQGGGGSNGVVTGVEKVEEGFVVQTASKSYTYATEDPALAARWTKEISDALPVMVRHTPSPERMRTRSNQT